MADPDVDQKPEGQNEVKDEHEQSKESEWDDILGNGSLMKKVNTSRIENIHNKLERDSGC